MEMSQVRYVLAATRLLNFTRAAAELNVSQLGSYPRFPFETKQNRQALSLASCTESFQRFLQK